MYYGECYIDCPHSTKIDSHSCVDPKEIIHYDETLEEIFLVKEFYDLSTTKQRISELFTLEANSMN